MNKFYIASLSLVFALTACTGPSQEMARERPTSTPNSTPKSDGKQSVDFGYDKKSTSSSNADNYEIESKGDQTFSHSNFRGVTYQHKHYLLSYVEEDEQAEWVAYELTKGESYGDEERADLFAEDPTIRTGSAQPYEYRNSGYDRGHLAPSADMRFDEEAMKECFYMSNISPQLHSMNKGVWNDLEMQARRWARYYGRVYVVCGPILNIPQGKKRKLEYDDK